MRARATSSALACALAAALAVSGCQPERQTAQKTAALTLAPEALAQRQAQTRRFDTRDEAQLLSASAAVLQDLGFIIDEANGAAGFIVGSKNREAIEAGQVASQVVLAALIIALGGRADPVWERDQRIRVSVATRPAPDPRQTILRVTIQRVVWNTKDQISRVETIASPEIFREFFDKLAQSVFLEANEI